MNASMTQRPPDRFTLIAPVIIIRPAIVGAPVKWPPVVPAAAVVIMSFLILMPTIMMVRLVMAVMPMTSVIFMLTSVMPMIPTSKHSHWAEYG